MVADSTFPVNTGTVLSLSCKQDYQLTGDKLVTCIQDEEFQPTTTLPTCGEFSNRAKINSIDLYSRLPSAGIC